MVGISGFMHQYNFKTASKSFLKDILMLKRLLSFKYAWQGITFLFKHETNAKIHFIAAIAVVIAGFLFSITKLEWCVVLMCVGGVFMAEAFNTAIEKLCDKVSPKQDPLIKIAKDVAAGAVLLFVISSIIVGLIIFLPHIILFFKGDFR